MIRIIATIVLVSVTLALLIEGGAWLVVGSADADPRYACAASTEASQFTVFSYGESTVYGTPVPEYGFMAQIDAALKKQDAGGFRVCNMGEGGRDSSGIVLDVERTLPYQPDVIIVLAGHNEFLQPAFEATAMRRWRERIASFASVRLLNKVLKRMSSQPRRDPVQDALPAVLDTYPRDTAEFAARVARYEANIQAVVERAGDAGVPVVFGTLASNLDEWAPVFQKVRAGEGGVHDVKRVVAMLDLLLGGDSASAKQMFEATDWSAEDSEAPVVKYLEAHFLPAGTPQEQADRRLAFEAVRDADPIPWRALGRFNQHVRATVAGNAAATLVDVEQLLGDAAGDGMPGFSLIADNCHPTPHASFLIARALLDAIEPLAGTSVPWTDADSQAYVTALGSDLALEYLLRNGIYVMKVPFFNYAASRNYLEEARSRKPDDWRSWANLASIELLEGNPTVGRNYLRHALTLEPDTGLYLRNQHSPYVKEAMRVAGLTFESVLAEAAPEREITVNE